MTDPCAEYLAQVSSHFLVCPARQFLQSFGGDVVSSFIAGDSTAPLVVFCQNDGVEVRNSLPTEAIPVVIFTRKVDSNGEIDEIWDQAAEKDEKVENEVLGNAENAKNEVNGQDSDNEREDDSEAAQELDKPKERSEEEMVHEFSMKINFEFVIAEPLNALSNALGSVYGALLPQESELLFQSKKLAVSAQTTLEQLESDFTIAIPEDLLLLNQEKQDVQTITRLMDEVGEWMPVMEAAQQAYAKLVHAGDTPMDEIELWRRREALLGTLYENLMTPEFKKIVVVLEEVENPTVQHFLELRSELTQFCLEARDNTRFLSTLERHFKLLQRAPLETLPDVIASLFAAIRMVWTISRYFNTEERLLPLLERVSLQLCRRVQSGIDIAQLFGITGAGGTIFDTGVHSNAVENAESDKKIQESAKQGEFGMGGALGAKPLSSRQLLCACQALLQKWNSQYYETRQQIEELNKEARRWEFDKQALFRNTSFMRDRVDQLLRCVDAVEGFGQITSAEVERVTGDISGVHEVKQMVAELPAELVAFGDGVWDQEKKEEFADIIATFNKNVEKTYVSSFLFIDNSFGKLNSVEEALEFNFYLTEGEEAEDDNAAADGNSESVANATSCVREPQQHSLAVHMRGKTNDIIKQYVAELKRAQQEFESLNKNPPIGCDLPRVAGTLVWCRSLYAEIKAPMDIIKKMGREVSELQACKDAVDTFSSIEQSLKSFEKTTFNSWKQEADIIIMRSLSSPLLGEKPVFDIETLRQDENQEISVPPVTPAEKNAPDALKSDGSIQYIAPNVSCLILRRFKTEMCVNFPAELNELIDEVKILDRLGFSVGETALNVALQKEKYERHAEGLRQLIERINASLSSFLTEDALEDAASGNVSSEAAHILVEKAVQRAALVVRPGFGPLNWNSLSVDDYLERALSAAAELGQACEELLKTINNIKQNIEIIRNTRLVPSEMMLFQGSELSYAAANPAELVGISIDPEKYKNMPPDEAMRAAARDMELKAAAQNEKMFEELSSLSLNDFSTRLEEYRSRQATEALEKYAGLTELLNKIEENAFGQVSETTNPRLEKYYKFWSQKVFNALIEMVANALRDYYILIRGLTINNKDINPKFLKHDYTPLFALEVSLGADPQTSPSIEELRTALNVQVEAIARVAEPFVLWEDGTVRQFKYESATSVNGAEILRSSDATTLRKSELFEFRKAGYSDDLSLSEEVVVRSFHIEVINEEEITEVVKDIQGKIQETLLEVNNYVNSWRQYEDFWKISRETCIVKFSQLDLTPSDLDYVLEFFEATKRMLEDAFGEKTFLLNKSKREQRPGLLTLLVDGQSVDATGDTHLDDLGENAFEYDENFCFRIGEDCDLVKAIPISGDLSIHPPYRAVVGFCVLEGFEIANTVIDLCNFWREGVMRLVIEHARPLMLEVYQTTDYEFRQATEECQTIDQLKSVLEAIVRIQQNTMTVELKQKEVEEYYRLCYLYGGIIETPSVIEYRDSQKNVMDTVKVELQELKLQNPSDYLAEIAEYVNFGYSYQSLHKLLQQCETFNELCNIDMQALAAVQQQSASSENSALELNFLTGKQDEREKKQFKTQNCRVFMIEVAASRDMSRKYESLSILAGLIDQSLDSTKKKFSDVTAKSSKEFEKQLNTFITQFKESGPMLPITNYLNEWQREEVDPTYVLPKSIEETLDSVTDLYAENKARMDSIIKEKDKTLLAQRLFNQEPISCAKLVPVEREMERFGTILTVYQSVKESFSEWDRIPFAALNAKELDTGCDSLLTELAKIGPDYKHHKCYELVESMIIEYKQSIPLLEDLTNKALRQRHWGKLEEACGQQIFSGNENQSLTLGEITALDLSKYKDAISDIVMGAVKEEEIENDLEKIQQVWTQTRLPIEKFTNSKNQERGYVLRSLDDIMMIIEDNSMSLESMSSSKYVAFFTSEVRLWEKRLGIISDVLESWMQYQREWLYLEGIFAGSDDLRVELPDEAKRFDRIDLTFVKLMTEMGKTNPNVLEACTASGRLDMIKQQIASMEACEKALTDYLNGKRSQYERFYFISDDELLSILGSASDPRSVQEHMRKMFDNVASLEFERGSNNIVIGMNSPEGEQLEFTSQEKIEPGTPIEEWMTQIDKNMKESLRILIKTGIYDFGANYATEERVKWVKKHICQVCIVSSEVYHTWDMEEAFRIMSAEDDNPDAHNAMKINLERKTEQINELVTEVRTDLTRQARSKINTLLIVDIHHQTILDDMIKNNVIETTDFNYESQLRFYYLAKLDNLQILETTPPAHPYLYEYQGLGGRLVITPLMDRLNMTLTTALNKGFFGAPSGPAGTGKTEGVKDLAKQLGRMCVVINCSEGIDVRAMASILSGACESGCWICFDEFNRIEPAVLSVISQQVKMILSAMRQCTAPEGSKEIPSTKFLFEGREIMLHNTAGVFCTMNPGYAGRSELPDNLKALFRPVVMCKPNLNTICENMLFSEGFVTARVLSQKMTVLYKLASEQLSKQYHYDFGLRALKSVLVNAGKLKRMSPDEDEDRVLMRALRDMNLPKFIFEDVPLFMGLISDLCPGIKIDNEEKDKQQSGDKILSMKVAAENALKDMGMELIPDEVLKVEEFYDTLGSRHSVMIVGPTGGGKTVIRRAYARANTEMGIKTVYSVVNPKAETVNELYGILDKDTREWYDGLLSKIFRNLNSAENSENHKLQNIILFDGDVDALWIENMNSVMDDNKLLTLPNNERIRMLDNCKLVFEVADLQYASPATVSRCGMVWVDTKNLGFEPRFMKWVRDRFSTRDSDEKVDLTEARNNAVVIFNKYVPQLIDYIFNGIRINSSSGQPEIVGQLHLALPVTDLNLVNQFCNLFDDIVSKAVENVDQYIKYLDDIPATAFKLQVLNDAVVLEALMLFCITWSIGSCVTENERANFDSYMRELSGLPMKSGVATNETVSASHFPGGIITSTSPSGIGGQEESTMYDYYFDIKRQLWCPWSAFLTPYEPGADHSFANIVVQTQDTIRNSWLLDTFVKNERNVLFVGESGTAKTTIVKNYLRNLDPELFNTLSINFSSRTGASEVQSALEDNLEKRLKDLGPPAGKRLAFFVDEISMPRIDVYGTQQPIALLKLFIERKGIYDKKALLWKKVIDVETLGCLPIPGGSHNRLDPRFVSLFCCLNITTPTEDVLTHIYSSIFSSHLKQACFEFDLSDKESNNRFVDAFSKKITSATLSVYQSIEETLSPTPSRFHYLFNLRDLSRVYEGLTFATPSKFSSTSSLLKLWRNEFLRVFCDRLICKEDKDIVIAKISSTVNEFFGDIDSLDSILDDNLIFGDFREMPKLIENMEAVRNGIEPENICMREYEELINGEPSCRVVHRDDDLMDAEADAESQPEVPVVQDNSPYRLTRKLAEIALDQYNTWIKPPLHGIVLFDDALAHLLRLHKIIRTPRGCALLVGYGGSGRRSLTRLATFMAGYELFEITLSKSYSEINFKDDLKELIKRLAPPANATKEITFLFTDQHVADESFLEAINSILTTGTVPALFAADEKESYINQIRELAVQNGVPETKDAIWTYFVNSCRERLHIVLSMSPVGEALRERCRSFPGLVSSCVIDWYEPWSDDGLRTVANEVLSPSHTQKISIADDSVFPDRPADELPELKQQLMQNVVEHVLQVHKLAVQLSDEYWQSIRRRNYVTPRNFVDYLNNYLEVLSNKRRTCNMDIDKFRRGLSKLSQAKTEVDAMEIELEEKKVILDQKTESCNAILVKIEAQTLETNKLQEEANAKNAELSQQKSDIEIDKRDAEQELEAAMPALEAAEQALQNLNPAEIAELRTLKVASAVVVQVFGCVYALKENLSSAVDWDKSKSLLSDLKNELKNFDKSRLTERSINFTKSVTSKLTSEAVEKSSGAALCIFDWVISMQKYYEVAKDVEPKKKKVREAEIALDRAEKELEKITSTINRLNAESAVLKEKLEAAEAEEEDLAEEAALMAKRLDAAERLISGLGTEKVRWAATADRLVKIEREYVGDCLITAAMMSYAGGFTYEFRGRLIQSWVEDCSDRKIPLSLEFDERNEQKPYRPELLLTNDVEILKWGSEGLPSDELSVMNGVMVTKTSKWPLIIDPELLSARWIKEKEKTSQLVVRTQNDDDFLKELENCIEYGRPFLLDNVGESLDPILTPILEKDIRQKGSSQKTVKLGDKDVDYDINFRLYLTSKLFNPQLPPDIFSTLSVINHCVTESGLEPELLNVVVRRERPDIEQEREKLIKTMATANDTLKQEEEKLLIALSTAEGNIVDNTELITTLEKAKAKALEVTEALASMEITAVQTEAARQEYEAVAVRGRVCYFAMSALASISTMYEYSLQAFNDIFTKSLTDAASDSNVEQRIVNIVEKLTDNVYEYVCTSLFESHKLMFSFMLATRIVQAEHAQSCIPYAELDFFIKGDFSLDECPIPNPHPWISVSGWKDLIKLNTLFRNSQLNEADPELMIGGVKKYITEHQEDNLAAKYPTITSEIFTNLLNDITNNDKEWKTWWDEERPESLRLPGKIGDNPFVTDLQKLCILRCLRPDRVYIAVGMFVSNIIGEKYIVPPVLSYDYIYNQSTRSTPILFIITPGSDPLNEIMALAKKHDFLNSRFKYVALGQGQSPVAESLVKTGITRGQWILLMNAHLLPKWLNQLDKIMEPVMAVEELVEMQSQTQEDDDGTVVENVALENLNKSVNEDFRLFLTTEPTDNFPLSILQNAIKIVTEPPNSLRLNLLQTFSKISDDSFDSCESSYFKPLVFTLAFFHASIEEREKFGKIGWNVKYDFNDSDFIISMDILDTYLTKAHISGDVIPWESIRYLIGEVNYGGRVMDDWDRRLISCYLSEFFGDFLFDSHQKFSFFKSETFDYRAPPVIEIDNSVNPTIATKNALTALLEESFTRHGAPDNAAEYIENYIKDNQSLKSAYENLYINKIPLISTPLVFGLHSNAEISYLESATRQMWVNLAELQPRVASAESVQKEDFLAQLCKTLEARVPGEIDLLAARKKFKVPQPTDIVLLQEIERFNKLLIVMRQNIVDLERALAGEIGMSADLDNMATELFIGQLPANWRRHCPSTLKPLSGWMQHLQQRSDEYKRWLSLGEPAVIWLSGLHIPESYMTALVQQCSRAKKWPLDRSALFTQVTTVQNAAEIKTKLEYGTYIQGLYLEGAAWSVEHECLVPSKKKELMTELPLVRVIPAEASRIKLRNQFKAPVYVTTARTNAMGVGLVFAADLASYEHESLWILQGVAVLLNDN